MAAALMVKQVYDVLRQYARKRPDLGVGKALLDGALEPANPLIRKVCGRPNAGLRCCRSWPISCLPVSFTSTGFGEAVRD